MFPMRSLTRGETKNRASVNFGNPVCDLLFYGGGTRIRTGDEGFAVLCLTTWLCRPATKESIATVNLYVKERAQDFQRSSAL